MSVTLKRVHPSLKHDFPGPYPNVISVRYAIWQSTLS